MVFRRLAIVVMSLVCCLGFTQAPQKAEAASCTNYVVANINSWTTSTSKCSLIGTTTSARKGYWWTVQGGTNQNACVQALGYNAQKQATWVSLGCGVSSSASVAWGNVVALALICGMANITWT